MAGSLLPLGHQAKESALHQTRGDSPGPVGNRTDWGAVIAGGFQSCARSTNGSLFCWGNDELGQVGNGSPLASTNAPVQVAGNATDWASVTGGPGHRCARKTDGRLFCWGRDGAGTLGTGGTTITFQPAPVLVLPVVVIDQ